MRAGFYTLGCKVNQYETQLMREALQNRGYDIVEIDDYPDVFIINSCTVTAESDRKTRSTVRKIRKKLPDSVLVLTGCVPQAFPSVANELEMADIVIGNASNADLPEYLDRFFIDRQRIIDINPHKKENVNATISGFESRTKAFMKIQDGCDRFCSYCIIPTARGFVRSRPKEDIKKEAEELAKKGFSEVVLVGINLSSYGKGEDMDLCDAVDAVCEVEGIKRVRLGSLEPDHISDSMLERFKNQPKFCPQFHLSLQSGCDRTLKRMNRHYDTAFYTDLVRRIRKMFPSAAITTDIMVGFAGETDEDFNASCDFMKEIGFARSHVFVYSMREGTVAAKRTDQVDPTVKLHRSRIMQAITDHSEQAFLKNQVGTTAKVLLETETDGTWEGYTENYTRVKVKAPENKENDIITVKLIETVADYCIGEIM